MIDVTGADLRVLVKSAYRRSVPVGMGYLHFRPGELSDADTDTILNNPPRGNPELVLSMDYVHGRGVKMHVVKRGEQMLIEDEWFDHSPSDLEGLLEDIGVNR